MLDPILLQTFLAVAQTRSFTQAAERLGLRQSNVSQQVRRFEKQSETADGLANQKIDLVSDSAAKVAKMIKCRFVIGKQQCAFRDRITGATQQLP